MSVQVAVLIADGNATRHLAIERIKTGGGGFNTYRVESANGRGPLVAEFEHHYPDDYGMLIARATAALRDKHGQI